MNDSLSDYVDPINSNGNPLLGFSTKAFFEYTQIITGLFLYPIVSVFAIIGSAITVVIYTKSKKYSTYIYLIGLSISDIIKSLNDFLYFIVNLTYKIDHNTGEMLFHNIYNYSHYIFVFSAINTSWLTVATAFDRYMLICRNKNSNPPFNNSQSLFIVIFIYITSFSFSLPSHFFYTYTVNISMETNQTVYQQMKTELGNSNFMKTYQFIGGIVRAVVPFLVITFFNYHMIRFVYKNKKANGSRLGKKSKTQSTYMLISIVVVFAVCIFPDAILSMMNLGYATENYVVRAIREITDFLLLLNSSSTFPICFYFSSDYRRCLYDFFGVKKRQKESETLNPMLNKRSLPYTEVKQKTSCIL